jgi:predicted outer membrane repeat protein
MKKSLLLCMFILACLAWDNLRAKMILVPGDSSTIQAGIDGADDGDTVLVDRGHYRERINFLGKGILVASNFIFDKDTNTVDSTIIDADVSILGSSDSGSVVSFVSGEDSSSGLFGFTIQNGWGLRLGEYSYGGGIISFSSGPEIGFNRIVNNYAEYGGAICCLAGNTSPLIVGNRIVDNRADVGGAILVERSFPLIMDNLLVDNHAYRKGGGIFFKLCTLTVVSNHIEGNTTDGFGGGVCGHSGSLTLEGNEIVRNACVTKGGGFYCASLAPASIGHNLFDGNIAEDGGGIYTANCSSLISNNTVVRNSAMGDGGGILIGGQGHDPVIINNIICLSASGEGIWCRLDGTPFISFNDVWGNASGDFYDCPPSVGDMTWGTNVNGEPCDSFFNISCPPLFCYPDTGNYHLAESSCCVGAGEAGVDIGAFGIGCSAYVLGDANGDGVIDIVDLVDLIDYLYRAAFPPNALPAGDTNYDGEVNLADIVCLLNYVLRGGELPC